MYSLNGIGTHLYGKSEVHPDGSYVATKWFIFCLLPVIPLGSYRVIRGDTKFASFPGGAQTEYKMVPVPMHWGQILSTYVKIWGFAIAGLILIMYLDAHGL
jgi:hypothetical protein